MSGYMKEGEEVVEEVVKGEDINAEDSEEAVDDLLPILRT